MLPNKPKMESIRILSKQKGSKMKSNGANNGAKLTNLLHNGIDNHLFEKKRSLNSKYWVRGTIFVENGTPEGRFRGVLKSEIASEINVWSVDRHLERPKCRPRVESGKNKKTIIVMYQKMKDRGGESRAPVRYLLRFKRFSPLQNISKNLCQNGSQKSYEIAKNGARGARGGFIHRS